MNIESIRFFGKKYSMLGVQIKYEKTVIPVSLRDGKENKKNSFESLSGGTDPLVCISLRLIRVSFFKRKAVECEVGDLIQSSKLISSLVSKDNVIQPPILFSCGNLRVVMKNRADFFARTLEKILNFRLQNLSKQPSHFRQRFG